MSLAVVRNLSSARALRTPRDVEDFEQEIVDQYAIAMAAANLSDSHIGNARAVIFEFARFLNGPIWTASCDDGDRFLAQQRLAGHAHSTRAGKAGLLAYFYDFVIRRYQGDVHALTGCVVEQPIDEYNRPRSPLYADVRVPPSETEMELLFGQWRTSITEARKYLPAARDYFAASLWRRLGLRINESVMLDIRDWRPDLGAFGKLHVRHGKGSRGRGPKPRLVPAINGADRLLDWWLGDVRHQFGSDWSNPDAPLLPSERRDPDFGGCLRVTADPLRKSLAAATNTWLPGWAGRITPHVLRHYCASSLYAEGMDLKALQELLGHEWLSTTTRYIHVHSEHIERAWTEANQRLEARFEEA
ncbi:tyrosine-type recombinase/integrase [Streptomyces sp. NBC_00882]|uniref:tyrosine-type recombinase/integrase n=1 Tax=Streptomyces sp. NBC_00882 TaxID=2975856 RepID=UPI00386B2009|nr:tyrosine-type recombinase/integrase [Streptomyces sp. NBC_00882]WSZ34378.1 tyrosine-type recombinase/integrase [Streptomyces sp. NBC_00882]